MCQASIPSVTSSFNNPFPPGRSTPFQPILDQASCIIHTLLFSLPDRAMGHDYFETGDLVVLSRFATTLGLRSGAKLPAYIAMGQSQHNGLVISLVPSEADKYQ